MIYRYGVKIRVKFNQLFGELQEKGLTVNRKYIDNFNRCPSCQNQIKTYRNEIVGVGTISIYKPNETKEVIIYCLCKLCTNSIDNVTGDMNKEQRLDCEEFITNKLQVLGADIY